MKKLFTALVLVIVLSLFASVATANDDAQQARSGVSEVGTPLPNVGGITEGFDDITTLMGDGWVMTNNSNPLGSTDWFQGNDTVFPAHMGASTSYIAANFNNTSTGAPNTISNWLLTPETEIQTGDQFSFWTRTVTGSIFPDRMEVRMSLNGASSDVGSDESSVGDFTTLLLEINPSLAQGGFPETWTEFTVTVTGVDSPTMGRIGFRYYVTDAGPIGANSNYFGIDTYTYIDFVPTDVSLTSFGAADNGTLMPFALAIVIVVAGVAFVARRRMV